ncbi:MAG TPA: hypothetical protein VIX63_05335 [Vicinamibacterales bacterium]
MLKVAFVGVAILLGAAAATSAQTPAQNEAEQIRARQKIFMMEGVLERAVQVGIDTFRQQLRAVMPDDMLLVAGDSPAARGFRLDGYGVFFDVEVPGVRPSLAWSLRTMNETAALFAREVERVRAQIRQAVADPSQRQEMDRTLARIQAQVAPGTPPVRSPGSPDGRTAAAATVSAQSVDVAPLAAPLAPVGPAGPGGPVTPPAQAPPADSATPPASVDPGEVFTNAVANALIDAMLENSGSLIIAPGEWLTVAARDNAQGNRLVASDPSDVMTIVLRVKGSDIADFQARRLTFDEVRKRVEVRAF